MGHRIWNIQKALQSVGEWNKAYFNGENIKDITEQQIDEYLQTINEINK
mgnify:CR=1 FL=1